MSVHDRLIDSPKVLPDALPGDPAHSRAEETEVSRQLKICNACRYCEGFCAVFPAMTRRLEFGLADVHYLANLCHNCGACQSACQYASPHEFAVNLPRAMARVRVQTYAEYAWPAPLGALYRRNGVVLTLVLVACLVMFLLLALRINGSLWAAIPGGDFYRVFPHNFLVWLFVPVTLWSVVALGVGVRRFLREVSPATSGASVNVSVAEEATRDMLSLKYLGGGHGRGCHNADDAYTLSRKRAHHLTFYGFLLCFAATSVATVYHYLFGWIAPYDFPSLPKLLGVVGGLSMLAGTAALFWLNLRRNPHLGDPAQKSMDIGFISLLFASAATGLVLWIARGSIAQSLILAVHLGVVMALFATLPYSKFAHAIFRGAALLRYSVEKRQANTVGLSAD